MGSHWTHTWLIGLPCSSCICWSGLCFLLPGREATLLYTRRPREILEALCLPFASTPRSCDCAVPHVWLQAPLARCTSWVHDWNNICLPLLQTVLSSSDWCRMPQTISGQAQSPLFTEEAQWLSPPGYLAEPTTSVESKQISSPTKPRISGSYLFQGKSEGMALRYTCFHRTVHFAPLPRLDPKNSLPGACSGKELFQEFSLWVNEAGP